MFKNFVFVSSASEPVSYVTPTIVLRCDVDAEQLFGWEYPFVPTEIEGVL